MKFDNDRIVSSKETLKQYNYFAIYRWYLIFIPFTAQCNDIIEYLLIIYIKRCIKHLFHLRSKYKHFNRLHIPLQPVKRIQNFKRFCYNLKENLLPSSNWITGLLYRKAVKLEWNPTFIRFRRIRAESIVKRRSLNVSIYLNDFHNYKRTLSKQAELNTTIKYHWIKCTKDEQKNFNECSMI